MNPTFRLGRIAGVEVGLNWSWAIVFALSIWSLEASVFPDQAPGLSHRTYVAMAVVAATLFFGSLLLHEFGHAMQARREGVEIAGITLWLFGGVAQFKGEFPSARAELRIAGAGPLVTLVIGSACVLLATAVHLPDAVHAVAVWLGYINLVLLGFNLIPALPLDGGRILRAALWLRSGDVRRATATAVEIARGFAFVLIGLGVAAFVTTGAFAGAWLAFIGWFLLQAAAAEARYPLIRDALSGLTVRNLMVDRPLVAQGEQTLREFIDGAPGAARYTTYPVVEGERVLGMVRLLDVLHVPRDEWTRRRVRDCTIPMAKVPLLAPDEPAFEALAELSGLGLHRGLVMKDDHLVGLLSITDRARIGDDRRLRLTLTLQFKAKLLQPSIIVALRYFPASCSASSSIAAIKWFMPFCIVAAVTGPF